MNSCFSSIMNITVKWYSLLFLPQFLLTKSAPKRIQSICRNVRNMSCVKCCTITCKFVKGFFSIHPHVPFCLFLSVSVRFCLFLSVSVRFLSVSVHFCLFLSNDFSFPMFSSVLSVVVRFCPFLSVPVCSCLFFNPFLLLLNLTKHHQTWLTVLFCLFLFVSSLCCLFKSISFQACLSNPFSVCLLRFLSVF